VKNGCQSVSLQKMSAMFADNRICKLFGIRYPVIQAGMVWCSGWKLASAVSNAGGLGLIGAGSMNPELLQEHIEKALESTDQPVGVNIPLMARDAESKINVALKQGIKIIFTSAGNPQAWTGILKQKGCVVTHVISNSSQAQKAEASGADAIVAEGFEAGGHNGREETTSFVLIPAVRKATRLPLIAAGGMYGGNSLAAAMALGADAMQVGSRFAIADESSAHQHFKNKVIEINEGDTRLVMKKLIPVRLIRNKFFEKITAAEDAGAGRRVLLDILGEGRSRKGIFEGDMEEGELEIGQISALLKKKEPAGEIVKDIITEYTRILKQLTDQTLI
jgi:enoyl-[acyl-carrier protein] reductase II